MDRPARRPVRLNPLRRSAAAALLLPALAACQREPPAHHSEWLLFGSPAALDIRDLDPAHADAAATAVMAELAPLQHDWHPWQDGILVRFNQALADRAPVAVPEALQEPLARARTLNARSDGLYDPASGALVRLWGFHTSDYPLRTPPPDAAALAAWTAQPPRLSDLEALPDGRVRSRHPRLALDFNGIAEGLAAERAGAVLHRHGARHALLALGGDVFALGAAPGRPWRVGLRDPRGGVLASVSLQGPEALFSSGNYQKFRPAADGTRWPHVLDPRSGRPATGTAASAVLHPDPVLADAAATALLVAGADGFAALVARMDLACALLLTDDDTLLITSTLQARIELFRTPARIETLELHATTCDAGLGVITSHQAGAGAPHPGGRAAGR